MSREGADAEEQEAEMPNQHGLPEVPTHDWNAVQSKEKGSVRSAARACSSYASPRTVTAAFQQVEAIVEEKIGMFRGTKCEVSKEVQGQVVSETEWMVHRQLREWHFSAGGLNAIDNPSLAVEWVTALGNRKRFANWVKERIKELDSRGVKGRMGASSVSEQDCREALEVAVKWMRNDCGAKGVTVKFGKGGWQLFDELLDWKGMLKADNNEVGEMVRVLGEHLELMVRKHWETLALWESVHESDKDVKWSPASQALEAWRTIQWMLTNEDVWSLRDQHQGSSNCEASGARRVSALRRGAGIAALLEVAGEVAVLNSIDRRMSAYTHKHDEQRMELISTLLQGSVTSMRMWARVLAQCVEVEVLEVSDEETLGWAGVARRGTEMAASQETKTEVVFNDMLTVMICADDEEGLECTEVAADEAASLCGDGGQGIGGSKDSAPQMNVLPDMPSFSESDSDEEEQMLFEKRQKGKFAMKVGVPVAIAGKHIDTDNILEGPRKRKDMSPYKPASHSPVKGGCELDDSDVGSEYEAAMGESDSSDGSVSSNFNSDDERVCDVMRRRIGGSPVWTTGEDDKMDVDELSTSGCSEMSVAEWLDANQSLVSSRSMRSSVSEEAEFEERVRIVDAAVLRMDEDVRRWLEDNQSPDKGAGGEDDSFFC